MKKNKEKQSWFKASVYTCLLIVGFVSAMLLIANVPSEVHIENDYESKVFELGDLGYNEDGNPIYPDGTSYHMIARISPLTPLGEASPGAGASGWLACFMYDYAETPAASLATNASGGDYGSWGNVSGYADNAGTFSSGIDLLSNDPAYPVCRARFNDSTQQDGAWNYSRYRVYLNCSGDETISEIAEFDNSSTATGGDAEISYVDADMIFINFWWDDQGAGADGYRITDDGSLTMDFTIEARY